MALKDLVDSDSADRKSTRLNSSHLGISYAVFCLKKSQIRCVAPDIPRDASRKGRAGLSPLPGVSAARAIPDKNGAGLLFFYKSRATPVPPPSPRQRPLRA